MLHTKFQASEQNGSEEEDFFYLFMYFYGSKLGPSGPGPTWFLEPLFEKKLGKGPTGNATYQIEK